MGFSFEKLRPVLAAIDSEPAKRTIKATRAKVNRSISRLPPKNTAENQ
jgi:hypothetical protein